MVTIVLRVIALISFLLAAAWCWQSPSFERAMAALGALTAAVTPWRTERRSDPATSNRSSENVSMNAEQTAAPATQKSSYSVEIGGRLKALRADLLRMTLREMAEFLNLRSVSQLERYEAGAEEYPLKHLAAIEAYFQVSRTFLESGEGSVFKSFSLDRPTIAKYLRDEFRPTLLCAPQDRRDLFCYLAFHKTDGRFTQIAVANRIGSFSSNGGGRLNIGELIDAMLDREMTPSDVSIVKATSDEWAEVEDGRFYRRHPFNRFGSADWECMAIFDLWFKEHANSRRRWNDAMQVTQKASSQP